MNRLKRYFAVLSIALVAATARSYADPVVSLNVNGSNAVLAETNVGGVFTYIYNDTYTNLLDTRTTTFTATYSNIAGVDTLNVSDVCAQVNVIGGTTQPCQALAFSFTDVNHTDTSIVSLLGTAGASVTGDVANIDFGATIGSGSAQIDFTGSNPVSTTPEPASLTLLATGLCGVASAVRRRISVKS